MKSEVAALAASHVAGKNIAGFCRLKVCIKHTANTKTALCDIIFGILAHQHNTPVKLRLQPLKQFLANK